MDAEFERSIEYVLQNEGGYTDNPNDIGSATKYGITIHMLAVARKTGVTINDVRNLTLDEAKQIYKTYFWEPMKLGGLDQAIATALLDLSVNMGQKKATELAQASMGDTSPDGILGSQTHDKLVAAHPGEFIYNLVLEVKKHYCAIVKSNPSQIEFLDGWLSRAIRLFLLIETT